MNLFEISDNKDIVETTRVINTPSEFAKMSFFYVQETGYLKSIQSHMSKRNNLSSFLFCIVLSGKGTFTYENHVYHLQPQDCILLDCMTPYTHQSNEDQPWELLWVHFNGPLAQTYYQYFIRSNNNLIQPTNPSSYIRIIQELILLHQKKEVFWEIKASKLITDLLTLCLTEETELQIENGSTLAEKLKTVKDYLSQNFTSKINLDQLAESFYVSKYHLSREFKRLHGITIVNYLTAKRITYAKELLRFTNKSIEEIAETCGYPDSSYFNKVFHKMEAMSGSDYRRKWRG